ncbi:MAG: hypothetical protein QXP36_08200 [Conexivisphaerales archaeon]
MSEQLENVKDGLGAYVFSIGFDLFGPEDKRRKKGEIKFGDIFSEDGKPSKGQIEIMRMPQKIKFPNQNGGDEELDIKKLFSDGLFEYPDDVNDYIWEYILKNIVKSAENKNRFDEMLLRLFVRKNNLLTDKEKEGFIHIKIYDGVLDLNAITSKNEANSLTTESYRFLIDYEGVDKVPRYIISDQKSKTNFETKEFPIRLRVYVFLNAKEGDNFNGKRETLAVSSPAVAIMVIEPPSIDNEEKFLELLQNNIREEVWVNKECIERIFKEINSEDLVSKLSYNKFKEHKDNNDVPVEFVRFYDFSLAIVWSKIVKPIRENLEFEEPKFTDFGPFNKALWELRSYQSYEAKILNLPESHIVQNALKIPDDINRDKINNKLFRFLIYFLKSPDDISRNDALLKFVFAYMRTEANQSFDLWKRSFVDAVKIDTSGDVLTYYYENTILDIALPPFYYPEVLFRQNVLDLNEHSHGWMISWNIMLLSMLSYVSQTFTLFDTRLNRHIEGKKEASEIVDLTHSAYKDFIEFYDQGVISSIYYRVNYEEAKEAFGINKMYKTLMDRLQLFSEYEISEENAKAASEISWLTTGLVTLTFLVFVVEILRILGASSTILEFIPLWGIIIIIVVATLLPLLILKKMRNTSKIKKIWNINEKVKEELGR